MDTARGSREFGFVVAGVLVQLVTLGIIGGLWLGLHATGVKFARDVVMGGMVFTAVVLLAVSPVLTAVQRNRLRAFGVELPQVTAKGSAFWRQWCYHAVVGPALMVYALPTIVTSWTSHRAMVTAGCSPCCASCGMADPLGATRRHAVFTCDHPS